MPVANDEEAFQKGDKVHFTTTTTIKSVKGTVYVVKGRSSAVNADSQEYSMSNQIKVVQSRENFFIDRTIVIMQDLTVKLTKIQRLY